MKKIRKSKKRDRVLDLLKNTTIHPTADWIYKQLKKEFPDLSMGTVYRNLNIMIEEGLVKKIDSGSTFDRFEANITPHYHFICEKCVKIIDLKMPIDDSLNEKVNKTNQYKAHFHKIEFFGQCEECEKGN